MNMKDQMSLKEMWNSSQSNGDAENGNASALKPSKGKKKTVEDIYQKKTQLEHILLRPDTYIGSVEFNTELMWVYDKDSESLNQRNVTYVPGLYKIFDEILVNAADHKQRDPKMDTIKVDIDQEGNTISIWNNGVGIPVEMHKTEKMYVPTMIFGHLLTSSNYDDAEEKVTGGRNGFGAKLCNIFSTKFVAETVADKKSFKQAWANNMSKASEPKIKPISQSEYTKITFSPDLSKFKMDKLDEDIIAIMSRRAYDVAACTKGVKVFLNGKRLPVKNFKDYVDMYLKDKEDDAGNQIKSAYELVSNRWEVAVALSDRGFQHVSFVNSIATTKGGRHVDYVTDMLVKNLIESLKKKNKSGVTIKPFQIKNHMWVFVNCLIVNPTFDSQTKVNMTLQAKSFGSKCAPTEKFTNASLKCGIVEAVMSWAKFKQQAQLQSKCAGKKQNKIRGIPKLEDANDAGTRYSADCTLIVTEGDSAKSLAVAGLGVIGRDRYGVFPLKGKMLNVREATHNQILENAEINNVIKIMGLQYKKKYDSEDDLKTLRYGKLMIMADQDHDGSHIKGLVINFIHHNWPTLLRKSFLEEFITPIVKASKGSEGFPFYSLPEFEEWKASTPNWHTYKIKYYKGLGTSTPKEAKDYFKDMVRHRIKFKYEGNTDDHAITMAFSKKAVEQRKEWLTSFMEEVKRRKELGLPDIYLYEKNTRSVNYADFVNKELVLFSNLDNERSIPSLVDGFKPGQRKVMFTCFKRNDKREIKVAQLAGSVGEHSAYHHGEASLMSTIINLAQNYVGSNNINLLKPIGQFGSRLQGGKDAASPRYIFTQLSSLAKFIYNAKDEPLLNFLKDDNQSIEPEWYIPIIPMVLVNGAEGIGTGWSTRVHNYNPRDIVKNLKRMINGEEPLPMHPWFKNFLGTIEPVDDYRVVVSGEIGRLAHNKFEITELPIRVWTQAYKESVMEPLLQGSEKQPSLLSDYREYHTEATVRFVLTIPEEKVDRVENEHKVFKLQNTLSLSSMVLFDHNGCLKKYESVLQILNEFYDLRVLYYTKRKTYLVGMLQAESNKLSNQARFIVEKCDGRLTVENKKKKEMIGELTRKGFDSDPVKKWKIAHNKDAALSDADESDAEEPIDKDTDFDYLLGMTMWSLTKEKKDELLRKRDEKVHELETLKKQTPSELWITDLDEFLAELDKVEAAEKEEESGSKATKTKGAGGKRQKLVLEVLPSPHAKRIMPKVDEEMKRKVVKAAAAKGKGKKVKKEENVVDLDEFDNIVKKTTTAKGLATRLGNSPDLIEKKARNEKESKKSAKKPKQKLTMDTDDELDLDGSDVEMMDAEPTLSQREPTSRRVAAAPKKYIYDSDDDENKSSSDGELSLYSNEGINEPDFVQENLTLNDTVTEEKPKKKEAKETVVIDSDSDFEETPTKNDAPSASEMFDSLVSSPVNGNVEKSHKRRNISDSESENEAPSLADRLASKSNADHVTKTTQSKPKVVKTTKDAPKPKKAKVDAPKPKKAKVDAPKVKASSSAATAPKKSKFSDSFSSDEDLFSTKSKEKKLHDSDFDLDLSEIGDRKTSSRSSAKKSYFVESESDSDF